MSLVCIYTKRWQPLSNLVEGPRRIWRCQECRDWRTVAKLKVQEYYDGWRIRCADGCYGEGRRKYKGKSAREILLEERQRLASQQSS